MSLLRLLEDHGCRQRLDGKIGLLPNWVDQLMPRELGKLRQKMSALVGRLQFDLTMMRRHHVIHNRHAQANAPFFP